MLQLQHRDDGLYSTEMTAAIFRHPQDMFPYAMVIVTCARACCHQQFNRLQICLPFDAPVPGACSGSKPDGSTLGSSRLMAQPKKQKQGRYVKETRGLVGRALKHQHEVQHLESSTGADYRCCCQCSADRCFLLSIAPLNHRSAGSGCHLFMDK